MCSNASQVNLQCLFCAGGHASSESSCYCSCSGTGASCIVWRADPALVLRHGHQVQRGQDDREAVAPPHPFPGGDCRLADWTVHACVPRWFSNAAMLVLSRVAATSSAHTVMWHFAGCQFRLTLDISLPPIVLAMMNGHEEGDLVQMRANDFMMAWKDKQDASQPLLACALSSIHFAKGSL